ncbi:serine hydrolase [Citrobacter freundii]
MRSIGDTTFRLDRWERGAELRHPRRCARYLIAARRDGQAYRDALGSALAAPQRQQFVDWLKGNTTGNHRIRAAVPADWAVGDKTGTCGVYGTANGAIKQRLDLAMQFVPLAGFMRL